MQVCSILFRASSADRNSDSLCASVVARDVDGVAADHMVSIVYLPLGFVRKGGCELPSSLCIEVVKATQFIAELLRQPLLYLDHLERPQDVQAFESSYSGKHHIYAL